MYTLRFGTLRFVLLAVSAGALALPAWAQDALTYAELKAKAPVVQSRADLLALMPGAKMIRINEKGNRHAWVNELNGEMAAPRSRSSCTRALMM